MNPETLYEVVLALTLDGYGRRKIAKKLDKPEWQIRKIIKEIVENNDAEHAKPGRPSLIDPVVQKLKAFSKKETIIITDDVETIKKSKVSSKVVILSDIHLPYHDEKALAITMAYLKENVPDQIILNGDIADFYSVSSYEKQMKHRKGFEEEVEAVVSFLRQLRKDFPDTKISFTEGNHETRLRKYLQRNAMELSDMGILSISNLFELASMDIDYYPADRPVEIGKLMITHGELARKGAGSTARGHRDKYNTSVAIGHIHRGSVAYQRVREGQQILIENPCLCEMSVDYGNFFDWVQGFTEIYFAEDGFMTAHTHAIVNYRLICPNGDIYEY
jgi:predicted phosphodiesterase